MYQSSTNENKVEDIKFEYADIIYAINNSQKTPHQDLME